MPLRGFCGVHGAWHQGGVYEVCDVHGQGYHFDVTRCEVPANIVEHLEKGTWPLIHSGFVQYDLGRLSRTLLCQYEAAASGQEFTVGEFAVSNGESTVCDALPLPLRHRPILRSLF